MTTQTDSQWVTFASGRDSIRGYLATPKGDGPFPVVVMAHENLGVTEHRRHVTRQLADAGFCCLTVDLFSRLGGRPPQDFSTPAERRRKAFLAAPDEQAIPDLEAGLDFLAGLSVADQRRAGAIGFCLGGGTVLQWTTQTDRLRCAVVLYGIPVLPAEYRPDGVPRSRVAVAPTVRVPTQAHFGGADDAIPAAQVADLAAALRRGDQPVEFHIYPGAGHAYHDDTHPNYDQGAAKLTWERTITFLHRGLR